MNKVKDQKLKNGHLRKAYGIQTQQAAAAGAERDASVIKHQTDK